jgi:phage terminase large subunit GpA-like protein
MIWSEKELQAWRPPERLTVTAWAEKHRVMDSKTSAFPGKYSSDRTPYARAIQDTFNDLEIEQVVLCTGTQVGKTTIFENVVGYIIEQDPNPALIVYPTIELAEFTSDNRIKSMLRLSPGLSERWMEATSKKLELQFTGMYLVLAGANSPASLASRPIRYLFCDETDKYPTYTGKEADPISLAVERTKTFYNRKIFLASTPTMEFGTIWRHVMASDVVYQFFVPCPHCGAMQTFKLKQVKWPEELNQLLDDERIRRVVDAAWYECEHCAGIIEDRNKAGMLRAGEWRPVQWKDGAWLDAELPPGRARKVAFHLNSAYSPWISFGEFAAKFLTAKDYPELLQNFINGWLGEPWRDKAAVMKSDLVMEKQADHERGGVPDGALLLTAGVDVQLDHFWWVVRAWGERLTSWLVDWGRAETWEELEEILITRNYTKASGSSHMVNLALVDSGFRTDEVYNFCAMHPGLCLPSKGSSKPLNSPYQVSTIERGAADGLKLWIVNTPYFKDFISGRLRKANDATGAWLVFKGDNEELRVYADHICSEQKVTRQERRTGKTIREWVLVSSHAQNHLLDGEVMAACAAEIMGVRYLRAEETPEPKQEPPKKPRDDDGDGRDWF